MSTGKWKTLERITESGLVAVIRAESCEQAERIADACGEGGVGALEVTFTVPGAVGVIENLSRRYRADHIGVGARTVLDPEIISSTVASSPRLR
jgi:2-dehydro-3-deoxyphosphogluconate aldolase / (4S)-4-hydroxy-2-oxoglutarate aldolase